MMQLHDTLGRKIADIHAQIQGHVGNVGRIGIALYNADSGQLSTFVHSSDEQPPLERYQVPLAEVPSLRQLHERGHSRIIDDLATPGRLAQRTHPPHPRRRLPLQLHLPAVCARGTAGLPVLRLARARALPRAT